MPLPFVPRCAAAFLLLTALLGPGLSLAQPVADLLGLYEQALMHNPGFRGAASGAAAALEGEAVARGRLLPQLSAYGEAQAIDERITGNFFGLADVDRDEQFERYVYGLNLTQAVLRPELWAGLDQAQLRSEQARLQQVNARHQLLLELAEAYFGALAAKDGLRLASTRVETVREQRDLVVSRSEAGLLTDAERLFSEAAYALARTAEVDARAALLIARSKLQAVAGRAEGRIRGLSPSFNVLLPNPAIEEVWVDRARVAHPRVVQAGLEAEIARLEARKAQRRRWPSLDLVGQAYELDSGGGLSGERDERELRIGARLAMPLFAGGQLNAAVRAAGHLAEQAEAQLMQARDEAALDARSAYLQLIGGQLQTGALREAVDAARRGELAAKAGFDAGTRTHAELFAAIEQRFNAEVQHQAVRYRLLLASLRLKAAAGTLSAADANELNRLLDAPVRISD
jgi:outer membrane protein